MKGFGGNSFTANMSAYSEAPKSSRRLKMKDFAHRSLNSNSGFSYTPQQMIAPNVSMFNLGDSGLLGAESHR